MLNMRKDTPYCIVENNRLFFIWTSFFVYSIAMALFFQNVLVPNLLSESTGILVKLQDLNELVQAIEKLIIDREYCKNLGMEAYKRCLSAFKADDMSELVAEEYRNLLGR